ncbi:hypothetical protein B0H11DRAFT_1913721 [Mycena galericulata]|nr:hypothetical protein B0H11DRAFT_1913721 [Mycena galericulata]
MDHKTHFPTPGLQFLSAFIHFMGVTVLTFFFVRRLSAENLMSREGWAHNMAPPVYALNTRFLLVHIIEPMACSLGIYLCVLLYTTSKILIYYFLVEKVYVVWADGAKRLESRIYLISMGTVSLYVGVIVALVIGVIGVKPTASLLLLSFDLFISVLLTSLFLWPLLRLRASNPNLRRMAIRTLLTALNGLEFGWVCLDSCGTSDVIFNAAALVWVTPTAKKPSSSPSYASDPEGARGPGPRLKSSHLTSASGTPTTNRAEPATVTPRAETSFRRCSMHGKVHQTNIRRLGEDLVAQF